MSGDFIENHEEVYRRVPCDRNMYSMVDGKVKFSSTAFNDPGRRPSVDRATLRDSPADTKNDATDGIVSLRTGDIRAIYVEITNPEENGQKKNYYVDVVSRPVKKDNPDGLPENLAHSQVESDPFMASTSRFRKLKEALAFLASARGWCVDPS